MQANTTKSNKQVRTKHTFLLFILLLTSILIGGCENQAKTKENQRQENMKQLANIICNQEETTFEISDTHIKLSCDDETTYTMNYHDETFAIHYRAKLPNNTLTYLKWGDNIQADVTGEWMIDSQSKQPPVVIMHLIAGTNQDQVFDIVVDLESRTIHRYDPTSKQRGNEMEFIATLQEALLAHASTSVINQSKPLLDHYGNLYQWQNLFLKKEAKTLRTDAYQLPFSIPQRLIMQFPVQQKDFVYQLDKTTSWDLVNQTYYTTACADVACGYNQALYDLNQNVVRYDFQLEVNPDTCTNEKFCEVSKTLKTSFIATLAFHSKQAPFREGVDYNATYTRGKTEELNRFLEAIKIDYQANP